MVYLTLIGMDRASVDSGRLLVRFPSHAINDVYCQLHLYWAAEHSVGLPIRHLEYREMGADRGS